MAEKKDPKKSHKDTNGPVVKTGPTSGQNRSRNSDGAWRAKRSDAGKSRKWNLKRDKKVYFLSLSFFLSLAILKAINRLSSYLDTIVNNVI